MKLSLPAPRRCLAPLLLVFALFAGGCVYLRLLELKNQLSDFDRNFAVETTDGVHLVFRHPVLLSDDLRWLGAEPQEVEKEGDDENWHVRWIKQTPPESIEATVHDVELFAELHDRQLRTLHIPERYFEFFPKSLFVNLLRSTGRARISKESRQAEVNTAAPELGANAVRPPKLAAIEQLLGVPTEKTAEVSGLVRYRYRYQAQIASGKGKFIEVVFFFDPKNGELRLLIGKLPKGTMNFNFPSATHAD